MSYKYLVTNGCSFVAGDGYTSRSFKPPHRFSTLLSEKLKCKDINLAQTGASNDRIVRTTFDWIENNKDKCKDTLLILGLTDVSRMELYLNEVNLYVDSHLSSLGDNQPGQMIADTEKEHITSSQKGMGKVVKWLMFYLEYFYSDRNRVEKFKRELILLLSYLKEHKVDVIIFNSLGLPQDDKDNAKYSKKITDYLKENTNFLSFKYNYYGKPYDNETIDSWNVYLSRNRGVRDWIAPDGHPGKESHKWLSTYIYDYIKRGFKNA